MEQTVFDSSNLFKSRLNMNGQQLSSTEFKQMRVVKHGPLFNDIYLVAKDPLKL